jgi:hypothetical protein
MIPGERLVDRTGMAKRVHELVSDVVRRNDG